MIAFRDLARIARHFGSTRALEVLALQASPFFGLIMGGVSPGQSGLARAGLLLLGSLSLTAHVFAYNDWAGFDTDRRDPHRSKPTSMDHGIRRIETAGIAVFCLLAAIIAFGLLGWLPFLIGSIIAVLSSLYSSSACFGKSTPVLGSVNHLLGGMLHFLLGFTLSRTPDVNGLMVSIFFGLVFAGGHLNQEVRDHEADLHNGIRTNAVVYGPHRTFLGSLCVFTAAYVLLTALAFRGVLPWLLLWSPLLWLVHLTWFMQAKRLSSSFDSAVWMQRRYRLLFALVGLAMLVR